jgi:UDP-2,3-diacylglucosamine hydrolase
MKTYFVSDAHLGSWAFKDKPENEKKLVRWMDSIKADCEALYMLGDMIDFWFEYKLVIPKGYARFFGKIAAFTDAGIPVYWFAGNHDIWLFHYVQDELGVTVYNDEIETIIHGKKFFMAHGDGLGDPSLNFRILRRIFHSRFCQGLFAFVHPRQSLWFGLNWAKNSRLKREKQPESYLGEDKEYLIQFSKKHAAENGENAPDFYVFGHRHILLDLMISSKSRVVILGDWIHLFSYGEFDGRDFQMHYFEEDGISPQKGSS